MNFANTLDKPVYMMVKLEYELSSNFLQSPKNGMDREFCHKKRSVLKVRVCFKVEISQDLEVRLIGNDWLKGLTDYIVDHGLLPAGACFKQVEKNYYHVILGNERIGEAHITYKDSVASVLLEIEFYEPRKFPYTELTWSY